MINSVGFRTPVYFTKIIHNRCGFQPHCLRFNKRDESISYIQVVTISVLTLVNTVLGLL